MMASIAHRRLKSGAAECGSRSRAGMSLIEVVVVISTLAALMSFATVLLGLLFRADHAGHDALAVQLSITRLSRQFRDDAHSALNVDVASVNPGAVELTLDDGQRVSWIASEAAITRTARQDDAVVARDAYVLSEGITTFSITDAGSLIRLQHRGRNPEVLESAPVSVATPSDVLTIDAAIGIDLRPAHAAGTDATTALSEAP